MGAPKAQPPPAKTPLVWVQWVTGHGDINLPESVHHRSGDDTIFCVQGTSRELTRAEWDYIVAEHPGALDCLHVLAGDR